MNSLIKAVHGAYEKTLIHQQAKIFCLGWKEDRASRYLYKNSHDEFDKEFNVHSNKFVPKPNIDSKSLGIDFDDEKDTATTRLLYHLPYQPSIFTTLKNSYKLHCQKFKYREKSKKMKNLLYTC